MLRAWPARAAATIVALILSGGGCSTVGDTETGTLRFAFGGDLAGQNICRDAAAGFPVMDAILARNPDFFVALGDMIYADHLCREVGALGNAQIARASGEARDEAGFLSHWKYVRGDPGFSRLLENMPFFAVWDDHEVRNDFGPKDNAPADMPGLDLLTPGRQAFRKVHRVEGDTLYFSKRFGDRLDMYFLDTRSYRDLNGQADTADRPKTMLGSRQKAWLIDGLAQSSSLWKVVVSSVPLSIPTGWPPEAGRDGWASGDGDTGFEHELLEILTRLRQSGVTNIVFISADVHFATGFRYRPFPGEPEFILHEFITGPLQAGLYPSTALDMTLHPERLYYHGPDPLRPPETFEAALPWFNFGLVEIARDGALHFELVDALGNTLSALSLAPRS